MDFKMFIMKVRADCLDPLLLGYNRHAENFTPTKLRNRLDIGQVL